MLPLRVERAGTWVVPWPAVRAAFLLLALALACGPGPGGDAPWTVVGRVSDPELHPRPLVLEQLSRHAVPGRFEIVGSRPVERLMFGIGVRRGELAQGPARFAVLAHHDGRWHSVFEEMLGPGQERWHERRVDLAPELHGATRFRFESSLEGAGPAPRPQACFGSPLLLARVAEPRRPDVVFLLLDSLGASYLGHYGESEDVSPGMDAFLAESFSFRRAYAQYGYTLASTVSLLSGLHPLHHGVYARPDRAAAPPSLVEELAAAGYFTAAVTEGGFVASGWGTSRGFDWYDNGPPQVGIRAGFAPRTFSEATRWLEEHGPDHRFFLLVQSYEVHSPYLPRSDASQPILERASPADTSPLPAGWQVVAMRAHNAGRGVIGERDLLRLKAHHLATIHELDARVAAFLDELAVLGLEEDTLVVLLADHGDQFGERGKVGHGESLHNTVLHVPLGFRWKGRIEAGESDAPVQLVDVMPTVLELLGLPAPEGVDGRSLARWILRRPGEVEARPAFSELRGPGSECERLGLGRRCGLNRYAVQTGRFKLVVSERPASEALYDLEADPGEQHDVGAEHPEELSRHRALLEQYLATRRDGDAGEEPEAPLDSATLGRLEALGYPK